jgi:ferredoxin
MLVIHPDECIDCGVCEPECPVDAIKPDTEPGLEKWLSINTEYAKLWPNIALKKEPPADAKEWEGCQTRNNISHQILATTPDQSRGAGASQFSSRVLAPTVRFNVLAIRAACVFFRASAFNVRTCSGVHARFFVAFLAIQKLLLLRKVTCRPAC